MPFFQVIVETPRDSREKYTYDQHAAGFILKKLLPLGMAFPFDFGFIPGTKGEDGDPLDAMIISEFKTFPGCRLDCRLIGLLKAVQQEKTKKIRNDRYFFVPETSVLYAHIETIQDLPAKWVKELLLFFVAYNKAEGKVFDPINLVNAKKAIQLLEQEMKV